MWSRYPRDGWRSGMAAARFPAKSPAQGWRSYDGTRGFPPFFLFPVAEEAARVPLLEAYGWGSKGGRAGNGAGRRGGAPRYKKADKVASRGESRFSSVGKDWSCGGVAWLERRGSEPRGRRTSDTCTCRHEPSAPPLRDSRSGRTEGRRAQGSRNSFFFSLGFV